MYSSYAALISDSRVSTHRQRTQGYIRELEKEVIRLREREGILTKENEALRMKAESYHQVLISNGLAPPDDTDFTAQQQYLTPSSNVETQSIAASSAPSIVVDLTDLATIEAEKGCSTRAAMESGRPYEQPPVNPALLAISINNSRNETGQEQNTSPSILSPQAGIDFVLE
jgi:hypothetical protein